MKNYEIQEVANGYVIKATDSDRRSSKPSKTFVCKSETEVADLLKFFSTPPSETIPI